MVRARGRVALKELAAHYKVKLMSKEGKERYKVNMLKVCRSVQEAGTMYVVPR